MAETRVARMHADDGLFPILAFDHLEFVCSDALSTAKYLKNAFGMSNTYLDFYILDTYLYLICSIITF